MFDYMSDMQVDLLDRLVIIRTLPYSLEEAVQILAVRAEVSCCHCTALPP
jgi:DNA helicase TIP49 (TBP-interacting protein)